jgi:hypothetical protein
MPTYDVNAADALVTLIATHRGDFVDGVLWNELLAEFHRGYPIDHLRELLLSSNSHLVSAAAFIASELPGQARPLLSDLVIVLNHHDVLIRGNVMEAIILNSKLPDDLQYFASALLLLDDACEGIRTRTMASIEAMSADTLAMAASFLIESGLRPELGTELHWLSREPRVSEVLLQVGTENQNRAKAAVIAAARIQEQGDDLLRAFWRCGEDADVRAYARARLSAGEVGAHDAAASRESSRYASRCREDA